MRSSAQSLVLAPLLIERDFCLSQPPPPPPTSPWDIGSPFPVSQDLHLLPNVLQTVVKRWLGINPPLDGVWMAVLWCALYAQAALGIHWRTTACGGHVTTRHNTLRDGLYNTFHRAGLAADLEVGCGWRVNKVRTRP